MPTWTPPPTVSQPGVELRGWAAFEALLPGIGHPTLHFVGYNDAIGEGRVSSPILQFDGATKCGISRSGRIYRLVGGAGLGNDAQYVWARWLSTWDATELRNCSDSF